MWPVFDAVPNANRDSTNSNKAITNPLLKLISQEMTSIHDHLQTDTHDEFPRESYFCDLIYHCVQSYLPTGHRPIGMHLLKYSSVHDKAFRNSPPMGRSPSLSFNPFCQKWKKWKDVNFEAVFHRLKCDLLRISKWIMSNPEPVSRCPFFCTWSADILSDYGSLMLYSPPSWWWYWWMLLSSGIVRFYKNRDTIIKLVWTRMVKSFSPFCKNNIFRKLGFSVKPRHSIYKTTWTNFGSIHFVVQGKLP